MKVWSRADTVVYLDVTMAKMLWRLVPRTVHRSLRHTELWNGNREQFRSMITRNPEENIILWSVMHFSRHRRMYAAAMADPEWSDLKIIRLCSSTQVEIFLKNVKETAGRGRVG